MIRHVGHGMVGVLLACYVLTVLVVFVALAILGAPQ